MFNQKEIADYRSISAPVDLRDKVLSSCMDTAPRKKNYMRQISSIAACFVLAMILTVLAAGSFGNVSVSLSGSELSKERSVVYPSDNSTQSIRMYSELKETVIPLSLDGHAALSVSDGMMVVVDEDTDEVLYTGTECSIDGKTLVNWTVCADENAYTFEMTVRGTFKTEKIVLTYNESEDEWTVTRMDAE